MQGILSGSFQASFAVCSDPSFPSLLNIPQRSNFLDKVVQYYKPSHSCFLWENMLPPHRHLYSQKEPRIWRGGNWNPPPKKNIVNALTIFLYPQNDQKTFWGLFLDWGYTNVHLQG